MEAKREFGPVIRIDGASAARSRALRRPHRTPPPTSNRNARPPTGSAVRRRAGTCKRKSASSRPYQRIERCTEGCAAMNISPSDTNVSSPSSCAGRNKYHRAPRSASPDMHCDRCLSDASMGSGGASTMARAIAAPSPSKSRCISRCSWRSRIRPPAGAFAAGERARDVEFRDQFVQPGCCRRARSWSAPRRSARPPRDIDSILARRSDDRACRSGGRRGRCARRDGIGARAPSVWPAGSISGSNPWLTLLT